MKIDLAKKNIRPPPSKLTGLTCAENGQLLIEKLKNLACQIMDTRVEVEDCSDDSAERCCPDSEEGPSQVRDLHPSS